MYDYIRAILKKKRANELHKAASNYVYSFIVSSELWRS